MKRNNFAALTIVLLIVLSVLGCGNVRDVAKAVNQQLLIMPEAGKQPLLDLINNAHKSVSLVVYEFEDDDQNSATNIATALLNAKLRGVNVRVIINGFDKPNSYELWARNYLDKNRIDYRVATDKFVYTHQKTLIVDETQALIATFNCVDTRKSNYFARTRDFAVITSSSDEVLEVAALFECDWQNAAKHTADTPAMTVSSLVCSPVNARAKLSALIRNAKSALYLYQQELGDLNSHNEGLCRDVAEAAERGVDVRVICSDMDANLREVQYLRKHGASIEVVRSSKSNLYIHAKVYLVDGKLAEIGSINMTTNSLERNRELGIITDNPAIIEQLLHTFLSDWEKYK